MARLLTRNNINPQHIWRALKPAAKFQNPLTQNTIFLPTKQTTSRHNPRRKMRKEKSVYSIQTSLIIFAVRPHFLFLYPRPSQRRVKDSKTSDDTHTSSLSILHPASLSHSPVILNQTAFSCK